MRKSISQSISMEVDGIKIEAWSEDTGDVHLVIDGAEAVILSSTTAKCLGLFMIQLAEPEV